MSESIVMCAMCSQPFKAKTSRSRFCPACRYYRKGHSKALLRAERLEREKAAKHKPQQLDQTLAEVRAMGMTYAEAQRAKTLSMIPKIEIDV